MHCLKKGPDQRSLAIIAFASHLSSQPTYLAHIFQENGGSGQRPSKYGDLRASFSSMLRYSELINSKGHGFAGGVSFTYLVSGISCSLRFCLRGRWRIEPKFLIAKLSNHQGQRFVALYLPPGTYIFSHALLQSLGDFWGNWKDYIMGNVIGLLLS
jgi:hypothetical protein